MRLVILILLLGCLRPSTSQRYTCPNAGDAPKKLKNNLKKAVLTKSKARTLCAFVHIDHADPTSTDDIVLTSSSRFADFKYTAALRSYEKSDWALSPGPFEESAGIRVQKCNKRKCVLRFDTADPYMSTGDFFLITYSHQATFEEELSRLFGQATFGGTNEMITGWKYDKDLNGMTTWIKDQVALPTTSLRETFRKSADFSMAGKTGTSTSTVIPRHPCDKYSRWRTYAFGGDEFGKQFEVKKASGNRKLILVDGSPRTYVSEWKSTAAGASSETGTNFFLGFRVGEDIGGQVIYKKDSGYKFVAGGNPEIILDSGAIGRDKEILVINLPDRNQFETINAVKSPDLFDVPASGSIRAKKSFSNNSGCSNVPVISNYRKVLGKFPDNTYVWYDAYAELKENTEESPIADGGKSSVDAGLRYCSNVARNFLNMETCTLNQDVTCVGSPNELWEPQKQLPNTVVCGSKNEIANDPNLDAAKTSVFQFQGGGSSSFYSAYFVQKMAAWYMTKFYAQDQLRHRVAWAFSQLLVVTQNQIDNGSLWAEMFLNYQDIFVRNAFGNYRDILREVSYSPMMGEMLSYMDSASALYALQREGRVSRPDENYAREIMQLFTVGLYKLNIDGTVKRDDEGLPIPTYDNFDIQTFARAWTGFTRHGSRANYEAFWWNPNKIDPMFLNGEKRDPFPKLGMNDKYIADGYPLCNELPQYDFLLKGATYRAVGNFNRPQLTPETGFWKDHDGTKRLELDTGSSLYKALCDAKGNKCSYPGFVRLEEDLECTGVECNLDTMTIIKMKDDLYYEYMPSACAELAFSRAPNKVVDNYYRAACADPGVKDVVTDTCCPGPEDSTPFWINKAWSYCEYSGEKVSYLVNEARCTDKNGTVCDFERVLSSGKDGSCGLGIQRWSSSWNWTNQTCSYKVKVDNNGLISIVHDPNLDVNSEAEEAYQQSVHQMVSPDNKNFFKIKWDENAYPSLTNGCGTCQTLSDGCLCDVEVKEEKAFKRSPRKVKDLLAVVKLVSPHPDSYNTGYILKSTKRGIQTWSVPTDKRPTKRSIFGVEIDGKWSYFFNKKNVVKIANGDTTYSFRNPPSLMKLLEQKSVDAYHETEAVIDHYLNHANTPPFIAKLMIKRFVTSNPSSAYVSRAAEAFKKGKFEAENGVTFGKGIRGDLEALFAAILLDAEARSPVLDTDPTFGSFKEPILKLLALMRAMEFELNDSVSTLRFKDMIQKIGQEPFATPNVFSFFLPEYANPGIVKDAKLTSPEAQIITSPTIVGFMNGVMSMVDTGLSNCYGGFGLKAVNNCAGFQSSYDRNVEARGALKFAPQGQTSDAIIDELALLLTAGRLADSTKLELKKTYDDESNKDKALRMVIKLILMTPEFHTTNVYKSIDEARTEPPAPEEATKAYKALVYVNLDGGLDSFNVLVPHSKCNGGKDMFKEYKNVRESIAVNQNTLKTITVSGQICKTFGVHEKLPVVQELYKSGDLSFFANFGVLQQPVNDKEQYRQLNSKTALFAHNTQQEEINSVDIADDTAGLGILGRMTDILNLNDYQTGTVSVAGGAPALVSNQTPLLVVNPYGYEKFNPIPWEAVDQTKIKEVNKASGVGSSLFGELWSDKLFQSMNENEILYAQMSAASTTAQFENNDLGRQLGSIAKLIKTRDARKTERDVFYARNAGWDTHGEQELYLNDQLTQMNSALDKFKDEMKSQKMWDDVTIVFVSEFGRTLKSNTGNGSDHAWGGNYFAASGSMKGGKVFGKYPEDLTSDGPQIVSDVNIVIPTHPWEALWNGIAEWFGITKENDLKSILPNRQPFENLMLTKNELFN